MLLQNALHWSDLAAPGRIGDTDLSGEAFRLIATRARGRAM